MEFNFWAAILAGFLGGSAMSAPMTMMIKAGKTEMDMELMEGAMFTGDPSRAKAIGLVIHLVMMSALVIGSIYALLFSALGVSAGNAWWVGAGFGVLHGVIAGMGMAMMAMMHPRMGPQPASAGVSGVSLGEPGLFARNYGKATPTGVLIAHTVYGLLA